MVKKLRQLLTDKMCIQKLLDFGSVPVFGPRVWTLVLSLLKTPFRVARLFWAATFRTAKLTSRDFLKRFRNTLFPCTLSDLSPSGWALASPESTETARKTTTDRHMPLREYVGGNFYRGVVTGYDNAALIIDESVKAPTADY